MVWLSHHACIATACHRQAEGLLDPNRHLGRERGLLVDEVKERHAAHAEAVREADRPGSSSQPGGR
jgi:hypothetical protein